MNYYEVVMVSKWRNQRGVVSVPADSAAEAMRVANVRWPGYKAERAARTK